MDEPKSPPPPRISEQPIVGCIVNIVSLLLTAALWCAAIFAPLELAQRDSLAAMGLAIAAISAVVSILLTARAQRWRPPTNPTLAEKDRYWRARGCMAYGVYIASTWVLCFVFNALLFLLSFDPESTFRSGNVMNPVSVLSISFAMWLTALVLIAWSMQRN